MAMRLSMLSMMWMLDPAKAEMQTRKMFSEKEDAMQESIKQMMAAHMMFWFDAWQGLSNGDKDGGMVTNESSPKSPARPVGLDPL